MLPCGNGNWIPHETLNGTGRRKKAEIMARRTDRRAPPSRPLIKKQFRCFTRHFGRISVYLSDALFTENVAFPVRLLYGGILKQKFAFTSMRCMPLVQRRVRVFFCSRALISRRAKKSALGIRSKRVREYADGELLRRGCSLRPLRWGDWWRFFVPERFCFWYSYSVVQSKVNPE